MASSASAGTTEDDEQRYRAEVLSLELDADETEDRLDARLVAEAAALGLRVADIQIAASLAASIHAGCLDFSNSSSGSSWDRSASAATSPSTSTPTRSSYSLAHVDHPLASSLSDTTPSDREHSDSVPSIDSWSTCPTSISSSDARRSQPSHSHVPQAQRNSVSSSSAAHRKRSSFIHAIGKPFRRRRMPSAVSLPPDAQVMLRREGVASTVLVETKPPSSHNNHSHETTPAPREKLHIEVPVFDEAAVQRSLDNEQLRELYNRHKTVRQRFVRLQNDVLDTLKARHLAVIAEKKIRNETEQREREKKNNARIARMEERQLEIEIDQIKEFDKAKRHSDIRIKHMEGYFHNPSPPSSPSLHGGSSHSPSRTVTQRQKEQLAQEYHDRDSMHQLHEARVKVLRERQERQLQETATRLENELAALINRNSESIADLERDHQREEQEILQAFDGRKRKLRWRWNIEEAILRTKLQQRDGVPYGPLPTISFSSPDDEAPVLRNPFAVQA